MSDPRDLLHRPAPETAPLLLGWLLRNRSPDGSVVVKLTEVEAYDGEGDPASHAARGRTPRNQVMFGKAGHLYVYFSYGMHWCANVVCGEEGTASAVLLRAGRVIEGVDLARSRRPTGHTGQRARPGARLPHPGAGHRSPARRRGLVRTRRSGADTGRPRAGPRERPPGRCQRCCRGAMAVLDPRGPYGLHLQAQPARRPDQLTLPSCTTVAGATVVQDARRADSRTPAAPQATERSRPRNNCARAPVERANQPDRCSNCAHDQFARLRRTRVHRAARSIGSANRQDRCSNYACAPVWRANRRDRCSNCAHEQFARLRKVLTAFIKPRAVQHKLRAVQQQRVSRTARLGAGELPQSIRGLGSTSRGLCGGGASVEHPVSVRKRLGSAPQVGDAGLELGKLFADAVRRRTASTRPGRDRTVNGEH